MKTDGKIFGEACAEELKIGDIVEWVKFDSEQQSWLSNYGILIDIKNEIRSNRLVSISKVVPLSNSLQELEFFTMSLRKIDIENQ
tara:strand:- start:587 stop:841 length:255 start_codon:yes stop_codon:yes gene_type:complete